MKIVVDLDLHQAIQDFTIVQPAGVYDFKSQDTIDLWIYFVRIGVVQDFGAGFAIKFGMIATGDITDTLLAYQTVSSHQTDTDGNVYYLCQVNFNTSQMASAIAGKAQLPCTAEIRYQTADAEIIHSLNISTLVFPTILVETGVTPPGVSTGYPDASTIELLVHKNAASGYAGLDASSHIYPAQLGGVAELVAHKDQPSGYPSLDATTLIPAAEIPIDNSTIVVTSGKLTAPFVGGDMKKSTYDSNNDGICDHAALADTATTATTAITASGLTTVTTSAPISVVWGRDAAGNQNLFASLPGTGDMTKAVYDINNDGVCDKAKILTTDTGVGTVPVKVWGTDAANKQGLLNLTSAGGGIAEAPTDGQTYGRQSSAWVAIPSVGNLLEPDLQIDFYDDFFWANFSNPPHWTQSLGGSGGSYQLKDATGCDATNKAQGVLGHRCGTTSSSYVNSCHGQNSGVTTPDFYVPALGTLTNRWRVMIPALATSSSDYAIQSFGLYRTSGGTGNPLTGICFKVNYTVSATNWLCSCLQAGTETIVDSGVAISVGTWTKFKIVTDSGWTSIGFYINNTLAQTITTNIPTVPVPETIGTQKMTGSTNFTFYVDYLRTTYAISR